MQLVDPQLNMLSAIIGVLGYGSEVMRTVEGDAQIEIIQRDDIAIHMMRDSQSRGLICTVSIPYVFDPDTLNYEGLFTGDATQISENFPGFAFYGEPKPISGGRGLHFKAKTYLYFGAGEIALPFQAVRDFALYLCEDFIPTYLEVLKDITGIDLAWGPPDTSEMQVSIDELESTWPEACLGVVTSPAPFNLSSLESLRPELGQRLEVQAGEDENHAKIAIDGSKFEVQKVASQKQGYPILEGRGRLPLAMSDKAKIMQTQELAISSCLAENTSNMSIVQDTDTGEYEMVITTKFPVCDSFPEELHPQLVRDMVLNLLLWHDQTLKVLATDPAPVVEPPAPKKPSLFRRIFGLS